MWRDWGLIYPLLGLPVSVFVARLGLSISSSELPSVGVCGATGTWYILL
jgi:hypothetical protein